MTEGSLQDECRKVGADEAPAQQGGPAKYALFAAADGDTAILAAAGPSAGPHELMHIKNSESAS